MARDNPQEKNPDAVSIKEYLALLNSLRMRGAQIPEMKSEEDVIAYAKELGLIE